ncbi:MAG: GWxTD domain-containing protein, partial [bacterium]
MNLLFFVFANRAISQGTRVILLLTLLINWSLIASPHPTKTKEFQSYCFEFLTFKASQQNTFLEIFCQIPAQNLQLIENNEGYLAIYEIEITLFDQNNFQTNRLNFVDSVEVAAHEDMSSLTQSRLVRITFLVNPGEYVAHVKLTDKATLSSFSFNKTLQVPDYFNKDLSMSDLQMASSISRTDTESVLVKNNMKIIPNVGRIFGSSNNILYVYFEVYNLLFHESEPNKKLNATYTIVDKSGSAVKTVMHKYEKPGDTCALSQGIPIDELASGQYKLILIVQDIDNAQKVSKFAYFTIVRPDNQLSDEEFNTLLRKLKNRTSNNEIEYLKSLPEHKRADSMRQLWERMDPTPDTEQNEFSSEYFRRIFYADEHFHSVKGNGWETDQGKIYIKNG